MGDEYTFGAPRVWRIANSDDIVPQGVTIFNDKAPQDIASEINGPPPPGRKFTSWKEFKRDVIDAGPHLPNSYYKSMVEAIKTTAKKETTKGNGF
ncbi:uncharacterized protein FOBCDRAFT_275206 [Fusarium oxysporum Fo47]|nr:uncharacterized protein FOBCDRAFT_275206 [Fusarium oxysporum Fo47]WJG35494.1 hypothetical protein FOBCDRAFT_275206 [Fusarium oxysporum Fo47]